jgi:hypothetical protein
MARRRLSGEGRRLLDRGLSAGTYDGGGARGGGRIGGEAAARPRKEVPRASYDGDKSKALFFAAKEGDVGKVQALITAGADPNWKSPEEYGSTALHQAAGLGDDYGGPAIMRELCEGTEADPNAVEEKCGNTPLMCAVVNDMQSGSMPEYTETVAGCC